MSLNQVLFRTASHVCEVVVPNSEQRGVREIGIWHLAHPEGFAVRRVVLVTGPSGANYVGHPLTK